MVVAMFISGLFRCNVSLNQIEIRSTILRVTLRRLLARLGSISIADVPEPGTWGMLVVGLLGLAAFRSSIRG